jgi:hypothetical protein
MAVTFDTLKFVEKLEAGGFSHPQAKAAAEAFAEATGQELVTKGDLTEFKYDLLKWVVGLALAQMGLVVGVLIKLSASHP